MKMTVSKIRNLLDETQKYADKQSGCKKVAVGSAICINGTDRTVVYGANETYPVCCKGAGCQREELYGENSKAHRLPSDCRAIHSEVSAICSAARYGMSTKDATILVTRYPCEACARAIVAAGINRVVYGRKQEISEQTRKIFEEGKVQVVWIKDWTYEDTED